jgi:hypothetical protein
MLRVLFIAVALTGLACGRDKGPTTPTVPDDAAFGTMAPGADDDDGGGGGGAPQSDDVKSTVILTRLHSKLRECEGQDGHYFENHGVWYGNSTGDPRLSGDFELHLVLDLFNSTEGNGPQYGKVLIRDPITGRKKVEGESSAWGSNFVKGTIVGVARDEGSGAEATTGAGKLVAGFEFGVLGDGSLAIQIGGAAADNSMPAGISSGRCRGKFIEEDFYFPPPGAAVGTASISGKNWRRGSR